MISLYACWLVQLQMIFVVAMALINNYNYFVSAGVIRICSRFFCLLVQFVCFCVFFVCVYLVLVFYLCCYNYTELRNVTL